MITPTLRNPAGRRFARPAMCVRTGKERDQKSEKREPRKVFAIELPRIADDLPKSRTTGDEPKNENNEKWFHSRAENREQQDI